jgi:hypothetical protein
MPIPPTQPTDIPPNPTALENPMTDFHSPHAETPTELGHAIVALDRLIVRDLNDHNYPAADKMIEVLDDITESLHTVDDAHLRGILTGLLTSLAIRHDVTREDTTLPDVTPTDFVAGTPCGHRHRIGNYADGCAYATHISWATDAARDGKPHRASQHAQVADIALAPLGNINNPESLRDFIAGMHSGFETRLRSLNVAIPA